MNTWDERLRGWWGEGLMRTDSKLTVRPRRLLVDAGVVAAFFIASSTFLFIAVPVVVGFFVRRSYLHTTRLCLEHGFLSLLELPPEVEPPRKVARLDGLGKAFICVLLVLAAGLQLQVCHNELGRLYHIRTNS